MNKNTKAFLDYMEYKRDWSRDIPALLTQITPDHRGLPYLCYKRWRYYSGLDGWRLPKTKVA